MSTDPRVVARPAPRFHFPLDPLVAVQGANRSLRHGGDGRASPDGLLWCRWPHQTVREMKGAPHGRRCAPDARERRGAARGAGRRAGSGRPLPVQPAVAGRARGAAQRACPATRSPAASTRKPACASAPPRSTTGRRPALAGDNATFVEKADIADQLLRHSIFVGVEPSPIGVTAWSQPWIPLWLEWEVEPRWRRRSRHRRCRTGRSTPSTSSPPTCGGGGGGGAAPPPVVRRTSAARS